MARVVVFSIALVLFSGTASGAFWFVPDDFATIQEALESTSVKNGDTIAVRAGTYVENIDFLGKKVTLAAVEGPETTIIDGGQIGSVVTLRSGEGADSVLQGFTITNGTGTFDYLFYDYCGGGIYCKDTSPTISECVITANEAWLGGGIYGGSPTMTGNEILNNLAEWGAGFFCFEGTPTLSKNHFEGNVGRYGGGAYCFFKLDEFGVLIDNTFESNSAFYGGGLYCFGSMSLIINNIISNNTANTKGGGLFLLSGTASLTNNNIVGNTAGVSGGGIAIRQGSISTAVNTIVFFNNAPTGPQITMETNSTVTQLAISYSDVQGGQAGVHLDPSCILDWGAGMIDANPEFVDANGGDFHLTYPSPCRDTGTYTGSIPATDPDGDPRQSLAETDIGVDEYYFHLFIEGDYSPGSTVEVMIVGAPNQDLILALGSGVRNKAMNTPYGELWLEMPITQFSLPAFDSTGVFKFPSTIPGAWAGQEKPFQALCGGLGEPGTTLTNLVVVDVE